MCGIFALLNQQNISYNEIENEHSNHFYTSSTSSHSDVAKVYFIFILF